MEAGWASSLHTAGFGKKRLQGGLSGDHVFILFVSFFLRGAATRELFLRSCSSSRRHPDTGICATLSPGWPHIVGSSAHRCQGDREKSNKASEAHQLTSTTSGACARSLRTSPSGGARGRRRLGVDGTMADAAANAAAEERAKKADLKKVRACALPSGTAHHTFRLGQQVCPPGLGGGALQACAAECKDVRAG